MSTKDLTLMAAIDLAKEAEQRAAALYEGAAREARNPLVRRLLEELEQYERYRERGSLPVEPTGEVPGLDNVQHTSAAKVLKQAMGFEKEAEERYAALAEQALDPDGRDMFERLAREEHSHYLALSRAYYDVGDFQVSL